MNGLRRRIAEVQVAFMLLTRLPAGRLGGGPPEPAAAKWAFPLTGLVVGGSIAGMYITMSSLALPASGRHSGPRRQRDDDWRFA